MPSKVLWAAALVVAIGCNDGDHGSHGDAGLTDADLNDADPNDVAVLRTTFGGDRPVELLVPQAYREDESWPLLLFLHGYSSSASRMLRYSKMDRLVDEVGVLLVAPNGLEDTAGLQFWNATDFCCDFSNRNVDDVAYLTGLVAEISAVYNVAPDRVFVWGHSNGGFMAHRLACDHAETFAAIISFAGTMFPDETRCAPSEPVSVLQIHGVDDEVIAYEGDTNLYPGAQTTVARWAVYNDCDSIAQNEASIDLTPDVPGDETTRESFAGCPAGVDVSLWTASGATHFPGLADSFRSMMWQWFDAHPKP